MRSSILIAGCVCCLASLGQAQSISVQPLAPAPLQPRVPQVFEQVERVPAEVGNLLELRALDKVNGRTEDVTVKPGETAEMFGLLVTAQECRYPAENPTGDAYAHLAIRDRVNGQQYFDGWMIASSPALNALDHRRYDVWVLRCKSS